MGKQAWVILLESFTSFLVTLTSIVVMVWTIRFMLQELWGIPLFGEIVVGSNSSFQAFPFWVLVTIVTIAAFLGALAGASIFRDSLRNFRRLRK